jgi:protein SCO1/2
MNEPTHPKRRTALWILGVGVAAALAGALTQIVISERGRSASVDAQRATVLSPPKPIAAFSLIDQTGRPFGSERLQGKWTFVFFGYTHCPDVCPTTLSALAGVDKLLRADPGAHQDVQTVFVSVDPRRDTPEQLAKYVPFFNEDFIGVTGEQAQIDRLARDLGIVHLRTQEDAAGGYLIDHTASILLIDPKGRLRALFGVPHEPRIIAADFERIRGAG